MNKIKTWFSIWGILIVFIVITLIGFLFLYIGDDKDFISEIYKALDTASAVALAILAFYAYYEYTKDKKNTNYFRIYFPCCWSYIIGFGYFSKSS